MPKGYVAAIILTVVSVLIMICFIIFVKVEKVRRFVCAKLGKEYAPYGVSGDMIFPTENVPDEPDVSEEKAPAVNMTKEPAETESTAVETEETAAENSDDTEENK